MADRRPGWRSAGVGVLLPVLAAAGGCGQQDRDPGQDDAPALMDELARGDSAWATVVERARREGEVEVRSVFPETIETELYRHFEAATGIRVKYSRKGGSAPTLQAYLTEVAAGQHLADVLQLEGSIAAIMPSAERMAEYQVPHEAGYLERYRNRASGVHPTAALVVPIVYNHQLLPSEQLPRSYRDLAESRYRGKIAIGSPENSSNVVGLIFLWERLYGRAWLEAFAGNQLLETDREVEAANFIARGERLLGPLSQTSPAAQIEAGAPLSYHWVKGTKVDAYVALVPELAPHPNAARLFVNFLLSPSHQRRVAEILRAYPVVDSAPVPVGFPELETLEPVVVEVQTFSQHRDRVIRLWRALPR